MSRRCPICNNVMPDHAVQCGVCGTKFAAKNETQTNTNAGYSQQGDVNPGSLFLVEADEKIAAQLSPSSLLSFLTGGGLTKSRMYFTNKRLYATIKRFTFLRGMTMEDFVVDLKDISATQVRHYNPFQYFIWAAVVFIFGIIALALGAPGSIMLPVLAWMTVFVVLFFLRRGALIYVAFPGHHFTMRIKNGAYWTASEFHQKLRNYIRQQK